MGEKLKNTLGMIGGQLLGPALGLAMQGANDRRQQKQQWELMQQQIWGQKQMVDYGNAAALKMWNDTNYSAQVEHMKKAGLNPALLYGMSGGGGATVSSASGNVTGGQAPVGGGEVMGGAGMGIQMALLDAQRKNIEANTKKTETETNKIGGVDTELGKTQIANLTQGIENQKVVAELTKIQGRIAAIDEWVKTETRQEAKDTIRYEMETADRTLQMLDRANEMDKETYDTKLGIIEAELTNKLIEMELKQSNIAVNKAQIQQITAGVQQKWKELQITGEKNKWEHDDRLKAIKEYTENALKVAGIVGVSHLASDVIGIVTRRIPKGKTTVREKIDKNTTIEDVNYH